MRAIFYYEVKVNYPKKKERGESFERLTEKVIVEAGYLTEVEAAVTSALSVDRKDDIKVLSCRATKLDNVWHGAGGGKFYRVRVDFVEDRNGKEKRFPGYYLAEAADIDEVSAMAEAKIKVFGPGYKLVAVNLTPIAKIIECRDTRK